MSKFIVLGIFILLILAGAFFYNKFSSNIYPSSSQSNTKIMYGYTNYDDYLKNRSLYEKANDEKFIEVADESINKGKFKDKTAVAQYTCDEGFKYTNRNDFETAIKRFNQAWLLDHTQPCVYAGFGYFLGFNSKDPKILDEAALIYEKAISLADPSSKEDHTNPWWIYIDYAEVLEHCYQADNARTDCLDKALMSVEKSLSIKDTPKAHRVLAFVYYDKKDYKKAWEQVHLGTSNDWGKFIYDLKKEMPDPQGKY